MRPPPKTPGAQRRGKKPYTAKSLAGAQRHVREQAKVRANLEKLLERFNHERIMLALLAATGPAFTDPLASAEAQTIRDEILVSMNLNPDGTYKSARGISTEEKSK